MSWLLFMDESGHDHKKMPYEVRGGLAIHAGKLWSFVQDLKRREFMAFGTQLSNFGVEIKGHRLLDKDRFKWAGQGSQMTDDDRRKHCRSFLAKGVEKGSPARNEFTAYGQACLEMAEGIFESINEHKGVLFGVAIPREIKKPLTYEASEYLRKDQVFLLERVFNFLESKKELGLIVLDEVEKSSDRQFAKRMERYFEKTSRGKYRAKWIVPVPFFVASDMAYPIQAADVCIYCINWGYRVPLEMRAEFRSDIKDRFSNWLKSLQFTGEVSNDGQLHTSYGIIFVPDPYTPR